MAAPAAEPRLDVSGAVRHDRGALAVRVDLANQGGAAAGSLRVEGELFGTRREAALAEPLAPGGTASVELSFPDEAPRPGVHGLALHLRYAPGGAPPGAEPASQRAYLLLALGANPGPSVRLTAADARVTRSGVVSVQLESADGAAHRVRLRALAPRGINVVEPEAPVEVPASGVATAPLRVLRAGAPPGSRAGLVVLASELDGPLERTAVDTAVLELAAVPPPWLPRLRAPLLGAALGLLAAAVLIELRRLRRRERTP